LCANEQRVQVTLINFYYCLFELRADQIRL